MNIVRTFLPALSLSLLSVAAHADVYGYIDASVDAHFADNAVFANRLSDARHIIIPGPRDTSSPANASSAYPITSIE